jgi:hypothetical protein
MSVLLCDLVAFSRKEGLLSFSLLSFFFLEQQANEWRCLCCWAGLWLPEEGEGIFLLFYPW